jgi:hypothetical protein
MSAWLLQRWSKRQLVDANDSIFFAAEGSDAVWLAAFGLAKVVYPEFTVPKTVPVPEVN